MGTNDTTNWERRLKGETVPLTSDMEPDYGFYRVRTKDRTSWRAMSYWYDNRDGTLHAFLQGRGELTDAQARQIWPAASKNAITYAIYEAVTERHEPWPDLNNEVTRLHNNPPEEDSFENLQERIDDLAREADRRMKAGAAQTEADADQAADVANALAGLWTRANALRVVEKEPHKTKGEAVDNKWRPLLIAADIHKNLKQIVCAPWLAAQKRKKEQQEAEAAREAQRKRNLALAAEAEARKKAAAAETTGDVAAIAEAGLAAQKAEEATRTAVSAQQTVQALSRETVTVGTRGRGVHLRNDPVYEIVDRAAMFAFLEKNERAVAEIDEVFVKHAKAIHKAGITVPGLKVTNDAKAA